MNNIKAILKASGYSMSNLVKCTAMLSDMSNWERFNAVYRSFFDGRFPARSTFGVTGLALGAQVEIECIATAAP
jgi:2-iminobutanoate/2-iminopropanoate deaminase